MKKSQILSIICLALSFLSVKAELTISDYCDLKLATPKGIKDITPLPDGESFAAISENGNAIEKFSYKTGKKTGEIFNLSEVKGELKIDDFTFLSVFCYSDIRFIIYVRYPDVVVALISHQSAIV